jgi:Fis family transcriptional regulator
MSTQPPEPDTAELVPPGTDQEELLLSDHVRSALLNYFSKLDGHTVSDLYQMVMTAVERPLIHTVLEHYGHNQSKAAQALGLSRSTLRKKISLHGLE